MLGHWILWQVVFSLFELELVMPSSVKGAFLSLHGFIFIFL